VLGDILAGLGKEVKLRRHREQSKLIANRPVVGVTAKISGILARFSARIAIHPLAKPRLRAAAR
jgi:hypothetical protein